VPLVQRWLDNYRQLKDTLEAICELNHHFLRPDPSARKTRRPGRD
jgi:hypothetical protein